MRVAVVIPTVKGREEHLERCVNAYLERTDAELQFHVLDDRPSCGIAWQEGAERAEAEGYDYLHLTADDIVPGVDWLPPMVEAADAERIPIPLVVVPNEDTLDRNQMPWPSNPLSHHNGFFEGPPLAEPYRDHPDWMVGTLDHHYTSIPFCSRLQWQSIGPMIAAHYGTDKWFSHRAQIAGFLSVVRHGPIFYHYAAQAGRIPEGDGYGWTHVDRITFDQNIAYPAYRRGELHPLLTHPLHYTPQGRELARAWYRARVPRPWPWEDPELPEEYR